MTIILAAAALTGVAQSSASLPPPEPTHWGEFARLRLSSIWVRIGTVQGRTGGRPVYWAARVGRTEGGVTDSAKCLALAAVNDGMRKLPLPNTAPGNPETMIGDGTLYSLTVPSSYMPPHSTNLDKLTITSGGGPLRKFIDGALLKLEPCWSGK